MRNVTDERRPARRAGRNPLTILRLCVVEARPVVALMFLLRFAAGAALAAQAGHAAHPLRVLLAALCWELAVFSVYLFNGVMDVVEDRHNGSRRPIARGALPVRTAARIAAGAAAVSAVGCFLLGAPIFAAVLGFVALGLWYSGPPVYLKRRPFTSAFTGMSLAALTYYAGYHGYGDAGWTHASAALPVFIAGTTLWIGCVGMPAKDLSDVDGDVAAGRRSIPARIGQAWTGRLISVAALAVATTFCVAGTMTDPLLLWPGLAMVAGAAVMTVICLGGYARGNRLNRRRPYRVFMVTQYITHLSLVTPLVGPLSLPG